MVHWSDNSEVRSRNDSEERGRSSECVTPLSERPSTSRRKLRTKGQPRSRVKANSRSLSPSSRRRNLKRKRLFSSSETLLGCLTPPLKSSATSALVRSQSLESQYPVTTKTSLIRSQSLDLITQTRISVPLVTKHDPQNKPASPFLNEQTPKPQTTPSKSKQSRHIKSSPTSKAKLQHENDKLRTIIQTPSLPLTPKTSKPNRSLAKSSSPNPSSSSPKISTPKSSTPKPLSPTEQPIKQSPPEAVWRRTAQSVVVEGPWVVLCREKLPQVEKKILNEPSVKHPTECIRPRTPTRPPTPLGPSSPKGPRLPLKKRPLMPMGTTNSTLKQESGVVLQSSLVIKPSRVCQPTQEHVLSIATSLFGACIPELSASLPSMQVDERMQIIEQNFTGLSLPWVSSPRSVMECSKPTTPTPTEMMPCLQPQLPLESALSSQLQSPTMTREHKSPSLVESWLQDLEPVSSAESWTTVLEDIPLPPPIHKKEKSPATYSFSCEIKSHCLSESEESTSKKTGIQLRSSSRLRKPTTKRLPIEVLFSSDSDEPITKRTLIHSVSIKSKKSRKVTPVQSSFHSELQFLNEVRTIRSPSPAGTVSLSPTALRLAKAENKPAPSLSLIKQYALREVRILIEPLPPKKLPLIMKNQSEAKEQDISLKFQTQIVPPSPKITEVAQKDKLTQPPSPLKQRLPSGKHKPIKFMFTKKTRLINNDHTLRRLSSPVEEIITSKDTFMFDKKPNRSPSPIKQYESVTEFISSNKTQLLQKGPTEEQNLTQFQYPLRGKTDPSLVNFTSSTETTIANNNNHNPIRSSTSIKEPILEKMQTPNLPVSPRHMHILKEDLVPIKSSFSVESTIPSTYHIPPQIETKVQMPIPPPSPVKQIIRSKNCKPFQFSSPSGLKSSNIERTPIRSPSPTSQWLPLQQSEFSIDVQSSRNDYSPVRPTSPELKWKLIRILIPPKSPSKELLQKKRLSLRSLMHKEHLMSLPSLTKTEVKCERRRIRSPSPTGEILPMKTLSSIKSPSPSKERLHIKKQASKKARSNRRKIKIKSPSSKESSVSSPSFTESVSVKKSTIDLTSPVSRRTSTSSMEQTFEVILPKGPVPWKPSTKAMGSQTPTKRRSRTKDGSKNRSPSFAEKRLRMKDTPELEITTSDGLIPWKTPKRIYISPSRTIQRPQAIERIFIVSPSHSESRSPSPKDPRIPLARQIPVSPSTRKSMIYERNRTPIRSSTSPELLSSGELTPSPTPYPKNARILTKSRNPKHIPTESWEVIKKHVSIRSPSIPKDKYVQNPPSLLKKPRKSRTETLRSPVYKELKKCQKPTRLPTPDPQSPTVDEASIHSSYVIDPWALSQIPLPPPKLFQHQTSANKTTTYRSASPTNPSDRTKERTKTCASPSTDPWKSVHNQSGQSPQIILHIHTTVDPSILSQQSTKELLSPLKPWLPYQGRYARQQSPPEPCIPTRDRFPDHPQDPRERKQYRKISPKTQRRSKTIILDPWTPLPGRPVRTHSPELPRATSPPDLWAPERRRRRTTRSPSPSRPRHLPPVGSPPLPSRRGPRSPSGSPPPSSPSSTNTRLGSSSPSMSPG